MTVELTGSVVVCDLCPTRDELPDNEATAMLPDGWTITEVGDGLLVCCPTCSALTHYVVVNNGHVTGVYESDAMAAQAAAATNQRIIVVEGPTDGE